MRLWPWVSREMHETVVAAKDEIVAIQRAHIVALEARLSAPVAVTVELPRDFAVIQQAVVSSPGKRKRKGTEASQLPKVDYAMVDERNLDQMRVLVNYHLGERAATANRWEQRQALQSVMAKIREARAEASRKQMLKTSEEESDDHEPANVPLHIKEMIDSAAGGN